jgi:ribosomal protein L35
MVRRKAAQSHFRANKSGSQIRQKRNPTNVASPDVKQIENYLNR